MTAGPHPRQRNRDFSLFWAGQTLSALGDAFAVVAVPLLVLEATGSLARMGLITALFGVGSLGAGVVAGPLVDRVDRRRLMIRCDLGRAVVYALIPLGWGLAGPQPWLLAAVTLAGAALGMAFGVASVAAVPNLVDRDRLTEANGRLEASFAVAWVAGPPLAGVLSARVGPSAAIGVDALTFLVSALSLAAVRLRPVAVGRGGPPADLGDRLRELLAGVRFLAQDRLFRWLTLLVGGTAFVSFGATDLFYLLRTDLGQGDRAVGLVFGLAGLGAVVGGLITPRLRRRWGFGACFVGGLALVGAALLLAGAVTSLAAVAVLAVAHTFGQTANRIASVSLRQELVPDHLLGRVTAAFRTLFLLPGPLGAVALTAFGERAGARPPSSRWARSSSSSPPPPSSARLAPAARRCAAREPSGSMTPDSRPADVDARPPRRAAGPVIRYHARRTPRRLAQGAALRGRGTYGASCRADDRGIRGARGRAAERIDTGGNGPWPPKPTASNAARSGR